MMTLKKLAFGAVTAAVVATLALEAHAQTGGAPAGAATKAPPAAARTPAPPPPASAGKAEVKKAEAAKKVEVKKTAAKGPSACVGLEQAACSANTSCRWAAAAKRKDGRENRAHCRLDTSKSKKK